MIYGEQNLRWDGEQLAQIECHDLSNLELILPGHTLVNLEEEFLSPFIVRRLTPKFKGIFVEKEDKRIWKCLGECYLIETDSRGRAHSDAPKTLRVFKHNASRSVMEVE